MADVMFFGQYEDVILGDIPGYACEPASRTIGQGYFVAASDADPGRVFPVDNPADMKIDFMKEQYRAPFDRTSGVERIAVGVTIALNTILYNGSQLMLYLGNAEQVIAKGTKASANEDPAEASFMRMRMPLTGEQKAGLLALLDESSR